MSKELPYMPSVTNVPAILEKIRGAGTPPRFTHDFLKSTLGFGASNDRAFVKVLKTLGFLSADGTPTPRYNEFKGLAGNKALAYGLREGWAELFMADQRINEKSPADIQATVKSVTGSGDAVAKKMASTFKALCDQADWTGEAPTATSPDTPGATELEAQSNGASISGPSVEGGLRLHHDIHIHLPPTSDVGVYRAIFQAMKSELM